MPNTWSSSSCGRPYEEDEEQEDEYGEVEGVWNSSGEISSALDESVVSSREMQITSPPYGHSGIWALTEVEGAEDTVAEVGSSWERRGVR